MNLNLSHPFLISTSVLNLAFLTFDLLHLLTKLGFYPVYCRNLTGVT
jgi:hypothetical protein